MKAKVLTDWVYKDRRKKETTFERDALKNLGFLLFKSHPSFGLLLSKYFLYYKNNTEFKVFQFLAMLFLHFEYTGWYKIEVMIIIFYITYMIEISFQLQNLFKWSGEEEACIGQFSWKHCFPNIFFLFLIKLSCANVYCYLKLTWNELFPISKCIQIN